MNLQRDSSVAVRTPTVVARLEAIDPQHLHVPPREVIQRTGPAAANTRDEDLCRLGHRE